METIKVILIEPKKDIRIVKLPADELSKLLDQTETSEVLDWVVRDNDGTLFLTDNDTNHLIEGVTREDSLYFDKLTQSPTSAFATQIYYNWLMSCTKEGIPIDYITDEEGNLTGTPAPRFIEEDGNQVPNPDFFEFDEETMKVISINDFHSLERGTAVIALTQDLDVGYEVIDSPESILNHYLKQFKSVRN